MSLDIDMEQVKEHEKAYIDRIKARLNIRSHNGNKSSENISKSIE